MNAHDIRLESIRAFLLPGGTLPARQTDGAVGYDVYARAVVCPHTMDETRPYMRKTLFDFATWPDPSDLPRKNVRLDATPRYMLYKGEKVLVGIGVALEIPFPFFADLRPRSGLASKYHITVTNAPGTLDPDYRGEAAAVIHNLGKEVFYIEKNMRIAQLVFLRAEIPTLHEVSCHSALNGTARGAGGFGSTGLH